MDSPALCCLHCRRERPTVHVGTTHAGRPMLACAACHYPLWRRPDFLTSGPLAHLPGYKGGLANEPAVRVTPTAPAPAPLRLVTL